MTLRIRSIFLLVFLAASFIRPVDAGELKISSAALERTLDMQLFSRDQGRYYLRGDAYSACSVVVDSPHVTFSAERVLVHVHVHAKLGKAMHGQCLGIDLARDVDVSIVPDAQGETIGFRDARIEKLSGSRELDIILMPFLSRSIPSSMRVNAADQLRQLLSKSTETTGYSMTLDRLLIHSMAVQTNALVIDVDGDLSVK